MTAHDDILADRLNAEPAIFKGCSSSELGVIVGVAAFVWLPVCLLLAGLMGAVTVSVHRGANTTIGLRLPGRRPDMNTALTIDGDAKLRGFERERWEANRLSAAVYQGGSGSREGGVESWK